MKKTIKKELYLIEIEVDEVDLASATTKCFGPFASEKTRQDKSEKIFRPDRDTYTLLKVNFVNGKLKATRLFDKDIYKEKQ